VKDCDVIQTFVNRPRAKSSNPTIELALVVNPDDYHRAEAHRERQIEEAELDKDVQVSRTSYISIAVQSYLFKQDFTSQLEGRKARRRGRRPKRLGSTHTDIQDTNIIGSTVPANALEVVRVDSVLISCQ
jgi:hypothetical protein